MVLERIVRRREVDTAVVQVGAFATRMEAVPLPKRFRWGWMAAAVLLGALIAGAAVLRLSAPKAPEPWTVTIDGECAKKGPMNLEDILKGVTLEDRIYRHRCVEAWSMVIPWVGFSLGDFIKKLEPTSKAKFVEMSK